MKRRNFLKGLALGIGATALGKVPEAPTPFQKSIFNPDENLVTIIQDPLPTNGKLDLSQVGLSTASGFYTGQIFTAPSDVILKGAALTFEVKPVDGQKVSILNVIE